jgi:nucleobase:cation symporter-1, NCS1 family
MQPVLKQAHAFGIDPVPVEHRVLGLADSFVLWADLAVSFLVMVVGMFLVPGLGFQDALLAIVVGALIGNVLLGLAAVVGSDTGLPTMVLLRAPLGRLGSYVPTVINVLQLLGWATFEVIVMAQAADLLATRLGAPSAYHAWVLFFTALTLLLALGGPVLVTKQWLEKFAVWAVVVTTTWITIALLTSQDVGAILTRPGTGEMSFWLAVDLVVALPISWFPLVADYSRFSSGRRSSFWGTAAGYFVPQVWFYALGALLVLVGGVESDPNAPIAPLLAAIAGLTAGWVALLVLLLDETDEGFANVYSTAVSIQNLTPRLSQRRLIVAISAVVLVVAWLVPLAQYESFLLLIGAAFVPLLAILCADYFVVRGQRYDAAELVRPGVAGVVRWPALVTWAIGIATYLLISGLPPFGIAGLAPWLGASLPSFVITFVLYTAVELVVLRRGVQATRTASA